jgi:integrase/recombinase XerD
MKTPRLKSVPTYLNVEQEKILLESFNRETHRGIRNFAIALLLVKLGLRASEVANLQLDDIDWKNGVLKIKNEKSRRIDKLPLLKEVGDALEDYVLKSRPKTTVNNVFLRLRGATPRPITLGAVSITMSKAIRDQGITVARAGSHIMRRTVARAGSHIMRRTVASRMVQNGSKIKDIADVLRHANLKTVNIYTKINIPLLKEVAMPWPNVSKAGV